MEARTDASDGATMLCVSPRTFGTLSWLPEALHASRREDEPYRYCLERECLRQLYTKEAYPELEDNTSLSRRQLAIAAVDITVCRMSCKNSLKFVQEGFPELPMRTERCRWQLEF